MRNQKNKRIRQIMELARVTIKELSNRLGYSYEWTAMLLRRDLTDESKQQIMQELSVLMDVRRQDLEQAEKLMSGEKTA